LSYGSQKRGMNRRTFVRRTGALAGGILLGTEGAGSPAAEPPDETLPTPAIPAAEPWPRRVLGRTGVPVTTMTLGTAPCGLCPKILPPQIAKIVNYALDLGINSVDTAPAYIQAEEGVESLAKSLRLLKTDWIDLVYYHSVGSHDLDQALGPDGVFSWLVKQKQAGKFRFLGISGHHLPGKFPRLLETGEVDVLLTLVNFVDRHTYGFEQKVLPLAQKHNVGIVAMKVFGGASKKAGSYRNPKAPPELPLGYLELALRYALSTPGVATANLGVHHLDQVRRNVEMVRGFKPLSAEAYAETIALGKDLADQWGPHFGPVA